VVVVMLKQLSNSIRIKVIVVVKCCNKEGVFHGFI